MEHTIMLSAFHVGLIKLDAYRTCALPRTCSPAYPLACLLPAGMIVSQYTEAKQMQPKNALS
jgi:hypothetical protein